MHFAIFNSISTEIFHVGSVEAVRAEAARGDGHAVDDEQRFLRGVERTHAADAYALVGAGLAGAAGDADARGHALQFLLDAHHGYILHHVRAQGVGRAGEG